MMKDDIPFFFDSDNPSKTLTFPIFQVAFRFRYCSSEYNVDCGGYI
jgi:hypothetical protein